MGVGGLEDPDSNGERESQADVGGRRGAGTEDDRREGRRVVER
jgi:hypothetical protein